MTGPRNERENKVELNKVKANKVKIGFFSFTEITDPREHRSYNEWHQLDHMPEQYPIPGVAFGQRWVSSPACRAARTASRERLDPIHYVTLYLMTEPVEETLNEFMRLGRELHDAGRWHHHRKAHLSGPFALESTVPSPRLPISAAAVPYRPNRGVHVAVEARDSAPADAATRCASDGVAGVWSFTDDARRITVSWLDGDPLKVAPALPPTPDAELAGPFLTITPWEWNWFD